MPLGGTTAAWAASYQPPGGEEPRKEGLEDYLLRDRGGLLTVNSHSVASTICWTVTPSAISVSTNPRSFSTLKTPYGKAEEIASARNLYHGMERSTYHLSDDHVHTGFASEGQRALVQDLVFATLS